MASFSSRLMLAALTIAVPTIAASTATAAGTPVFPGASGVGLDPPPGMTAARTFEGFKTGDASIVITEMPAAAYAQIDMSRDMFVSRVGAKQAENVDINGVQGFMVKGDLALGPSRVRKWVLVLDGPDETAVVSAQVPDGDPKVSPEAIDAALRTVAFRPRPGLDAQVAALPFSVGNLDGFKISATALGDALILVDGSKTDDSGGQAHIVMSASERTPPKTDHAAFAKSQLESFQAVRTTDVLSATAFDADGAQWAQVEANGSEGQNERPVAISYFVRFDPTGLVTIVCVAPRDAKAGLADRFKTVALSVKPKG